MSFSALTTGKKSNDQSVLFFLIYHNHTFIKPQTSNYVSLGIHIDYRSRVDCWTLLTKALALALLKNVSWRIRAEYYLLCLSVLK